VLLWYRPQSSGRYKIKNKDMNEYDVIRERQLSKTLQEDINGGSIRTDDNGLVAFLCINGHTPTKIYTKDKRPKWIYFVTQVEDESAAKLYVQKYYSGTATVEPEAYNFWLQTVYSWIVDFKRQNPEGGVLDRTAIKEKALSVGFREYSG